MASKEGWVKWPFLKKKDYQTVAEEKNGNRKN